MPSKRQSPKHPQADRKRTDFSGFPPPQRKGVANEMTIRRVDHPNFLPAHRKEIQDTAEDLLMEGKTLREVADYLGIQFKTFQRLRMKHPELKQALEAAAFEGSTVILEQLKDIPWMEEDPARARVKLEALGRYLELRWPARFGKRLDVTVKTLDMGSALTKARQRAAAVSTVTAAPDETGTYVAIAEDAESVAADAEDEFDQLFG